MKTKKSIIYTSLFVLLFLFTSCGVSYKDMSYSTYERGYWGNWHYYSERTKWAFQGNPGNFIVYNAYFHPGDFCYRITINNYNDYRVSSSGFTEFSGTIECYDPSMYFIRYELPSLNPVVKPVKHNARIKVKKEKKYYLYNVFFDDVGFAVTIPWQRFR